MKQKDLGLDLSTRRTRKQILLDEMEQVMPWRELLASGSIDGRGSDASSQRRAPEPAGSAFHRSPARPRSRRRDRSTGIAVRSRSKDPNCRRPVRWNGGDHHSARRKGPASRAHGYSLAVDSRWRTAWRMAAKRLRFGRRKPP